MTPQTPQLPEPIWRVGLCASSSRPHDQIPCLARSEREIESMEKHESFIRWLSPRSDEVGAALEAQKAAAPELVGLSERIKELTVEHGSIRAVSRHFGIDVGYLSRLESGEKASPGPDVLGALGLRKVIAYERITPPTGVDK